MEYLLMQKARKKKKMTQEDLARALGVQRAVISKYESGRITPSVEQAKKISEILEVPFLDLVGMVPENDTEVERNRLLKVLTNYINSHKDFDLSKLQQCYYYDDNGLRFLGEDNVFDRIVEAYDKLNTEGQVIAAERIEELSEIIKYRK